MNAKKIAIPLSTLFGFLLGITMIDIVYGITSTEITLLQTEQEYALKYTGTFYSDTTDSSFSVNTYETICTGYYVIEETATEIIYTGFGDLKEQYTFKKTKTPEIYVASSTPKDKQTEILVPMLDNTPTSTIPN